MRTHPTCRPSTILRFLLLTLQSSQDHLPVHTFRSHATVSKTHESIAKNIFPRRMPSKSESHPHLTMPRGLSSVANVANSAVLPTPLNWPGVARRPEPFGLECLLLAVRGRLCYALGTYQGDTCACSTHASEGGDGAGCHFSLVLLFFDLTIAVVLAKNTSFEASFSSHILLYDGLDLFDIILNHFHGQKRRPCHSLSASARLSRLPLSLSH